jgi:hypothetical protein
VSRRFLAAAALVAAFTLTGCVGSEPRLSHQEYEREMQAIARDLNAQAAGMEALASAPSGDTFVRILREVGDLVSEAADRVDAINPPEEIHDPHGALADGLDEMAGILDKAADRAEDGDFFGAMAVFEKAPDDLGAEVEQAIRDIRTAGYYIGDEEAWG